MTRRDGFEVKIYTIGHSTRTIEEFIELLKKFKIKKVVDVRTIPKSRRYPQFNAENLRKSLAESDIQYGQLPKLGGLRHASKDSINLGWRNLSFRGYADYMATPEFALGLKELEEISAKETVAVMCAEAVPWRCHRSLISDALTKNGWKVWHIINKKNFHLHKLTPFLHSDHGEITYPAE